MPKMPKIFRDLGFGSFTFGRESYTQDRKRTKETYRKNVSFYSIDGMMKSIRTGKKMKPQSTVKTKQVIYYRED